MITANKYHRAKFGLAGTHAHVKVSEDRVILALVYTGEQQRCVLQWKVEEHSGTGSSIHSVHSTFVRACALTWKCQLYIVLIQHCSQSQAEM